MRINFPNGTWVIVRTEIDLLHVLRFSNAA